LNYSVNRLDSSNSFNFVQTARRRLWPAYEVA
jgi:hypothetical protein